MPPVRTSMSSIKPVKTERTHEENQERAYIAASRRSDRSLEARVESARRASEIHKRRTGRSLRVTEQDVVNEEMYEEEDDDLPMQYRRLTAHLQTQNADFNRRLQAYMVSEVAKRQGLVNSGLDPMQMGNQQFSPQGQYMNPGLMQMQNHTFQGFQGPMMPPQMYAQTPANAHRVNPYSMNRNVQTMRQDYHNRSASMSVSQPQASTPHQNHYSQSAQTSPVDATSFDARRMSLPVQASMPRTPSSQPGLVQSPSHISPTLSRNGSTTNLSSTHNAVKHDSSPKQVPTPPEMSNNQTTTQQPSPFGAAFDHQMMNGMNPFSAQLPLNAQQHMYGAASDISMPQMFTQFTQPGYSYNPNGKSKAQAQTQQQMQNLNQTLVAPSSLDTTFLTGGFEGPLTSTHDGSSGSAFSYPSQDYGFPELSAEPFKMTGGGLDTSGQVTPINEDWNSWLNEGNSSSNEDLVNMASVAKR